MNIELSYGGKKKCIKQNIYLKRKGEIETLLRELIAVIICCILITFICVSSGVDALTVMINASTWIDQNTYKRIRITSWCLRRKPKYGLNEEDPELVINFLIAKLNFTCPQRGVSNDER